MQVLRSRSVYPLFFGLLALVHVFHAFAADPPKRLISMAPNITETLFALELGGNVVGVTRFCDYPEQVKTIANVGGYVDPSYEAIVSLRPDLVILLTSHKEAARELAKLQIATLLVPHETVSDIHEAIRKIGAACGVPDKASALLEALTQRSIRVREKVAKESKPRVLICIGRDIESGQLAGLYFAGKNGFYDEIISMAGGINACTTENVAYPQLSAEGIIQLNPDVIIDLISHIGPKGKSTVEIAAQWDTLAPVAAVRNKQVFVVVGNHALRPGPRYVEFLEELARLLHPACFEEKAEDYE